MSSLPFVSSIEFNWISVTSDKVDKVEGPQFVSQIESYISSSFPFTLSSFLLCDNVLSHKCNLIHKKNTMIDYYKEEKGRREYVLLLLYVILLTITSPSYSYIFNCWWISSLFVVEYDGEWKRRRILSLYDFEIMSSVI